ncbi:MAG TPA: TIGR03905 family TSCPD domain-containing protein [Candidatus Acutalibacter pullistercoris]|uniref:ribonucleoside-diphosphate reductase n=1 Tax=Candidatus Acutalibacter pullistercoris TaxID=2838418 RepID=A0A9D1YE20_9FIRM|nr:TIGR03905 family TSCPD domain-containing protein [Candidatus Acutalibacter pullistercoris]
MEIHYTPRGVCSRKIDIVVEDGVIQSVKFTGGCSGNTQGVAALAQGMKVEDYIARCKDIKCGFKPTSCPAQLAQALSEALQNG